MRRTTAVEQRRHQTDRRTTETLETIKDYWDAGTSETFAHTTNNRHNKYLVPQTIGSLKPAYFDIAQFSGDILKWKEFWNDFEASVHKAKYTPVDKLNYLKSELKGEALEAISGYQLSNENYTMVVDVLKRDLRIKN